MVSSNIVRLSLPIESILLFPYLRHGELGRGRIRAPIQNAGFRDAGAAGTGAGGIDGRRYRRGITGAVDQSTGQTRRNEGRKTCTRDQPRDKLRARGVREAADGRSEVDIAGDRETLLLASRRGSSCSPHPREKWDMNTPLMIGAQREFVLLYIAHPSRPHALSHLPRSLSRRSRSLARFIARQA